MVGKLILTRILYAVLTLLAVSVVVFAAVEILPGDITTRILGRSATPEAVAVLQHMQELMPGNPQLEAELERLKATLK